MTLSQDEIGQAVKDFVSKKIGRPVEVSAVVFQNSEYQTIDDEISAECTLADPDAPKEPAPNAAAAV